MGRRYGSKDKIIDVLTKPRTVGDIDSLTGMHPVTIYRAIGQLERDGIIGVVGFIDSPDPRGHKRRLYNKK